MKKTHKEPVFILETTPTLRTLILNRGHLLRSCRTRRVSAISGPGPNSWLQAAVVPNPGESKEDTWDKAHQLAALFERELRHDVYVEPGSKAGRYQSTVNPESSPDAEAEPRATPNSFAHSPFDPGPNISTGLSGLNGFGGTGISQIGFGPAHGMAGGRMPDPMANQFSAAPGKIEDLIGDQAKPKQLEVTCPALYELPGWSELKKTKQQMFETEAAQLIKKGLSIEDLESIPPSERSTLELVRLQPDASKSLKRFLNDALAELPKTD